MKIIVSVVDPYSQQPDDLDPSPAPSQQLSQLNAEVKSADPLTDLSASQPEPFSPPLPSSPPPPSGSQKGNSPESLPPLPLPAPTARQIEGILRSFKASVNEFAASFSSIKGPTLSDQPPVKCESNSVQRNKSEDALLAMMSSLPSFDALLECIAFVDNAELIGNATLNVKKSSSGKCIVEARSAPLFSSDFHGSLHRHVKALGVKAKLLDAVTGTTSLHSLEREVLCRDRLLEAYLSFTSKDKDRDIQEPVSGALLGIDDGLIELSKGNTSRAEAAYSLCNAQKRCNRADNMTKLAYEPRVISFSLYRSLHSILERRKTEIRGDGDSSFLTSSSVNERERELSILSSLRQIISVGSSLEANMDCAVEIEINGLAQLSSAAAGTSVAPVQYLVLSASVCNAVARFLVSPLFEGDVFGLLCYSSALGLSGFTPSSSLQHILPCTVLRLESRCDEASAVLLMDVSSSPLQR